MSSLFNSGPTAVWKHAVEVWRRGGGYKLTSRPHPQVPCTILNARITISDLYYNSNKNMFGGCSETENETGRDRSKDVPVSE